MKSYSRFRDYDNNRTGFTKNKREDDEHHNDSKPAFKAKSLMDRPHTVHIDGKPWKKFDNGHQAHAAVKTLQGKGKNATATAHFGEEAVSEATVDTADIQKNKMITQKDKDKLGNLAALIAKEKKAKDMKEDTNMDEQAEQIDELNKDTLTSYQDKADADIAKKHRVLGPQIKAGNAKAANKTANTIQKRMSGMDRAVTRLNKEETMSEFNPMSGYLSQIAKDVGAEDLQEKTLTPAELKKREEVAQAIERENPGMDKSKKMAIATATAKKVAEDVEQIDELSKSTLASYVGKAAGSAAMTAYAAGSTSQQYAGKPISTRPDDYDKDRKDTVKRLKNINKAAGKLAEEEDGLEEAVYQNKTAKKVAEAASWNPIKHIPKEKQTDAIKTAAKDVKRGSYADRAALLKAGGVKEDLDNMHYCAKHVFSERFGEGLVVEGSHAEPDEQGLIEWYDVDFGGQIRRVMTEKVKVMHAEYHMNHKKKKMSEEDNSEGDTPDNAKEKSLAKLAKPYDKVTHADVMVGRGVKKEEVEVTEGMLSYSDFQAKIAAHKKAGNKIVNDKYDDKKASYTVIDQDGVGKKIIHTPAGSKQEHLGSMKRD